MGHKPSPRRGQKTAGPIMQTASEVGDMLARNRDNIDTIMYSVAVLTNAAASAVQWITPKLQAFVAEITSMEQVIAKAIGWFKFGKQVASRKK